MESHFNEEITGASDVMERLDSADGEEFLSSLCTITADRLTNKVVCTILKRMPNKKRKTGPSWRQIKECFCIIVNDPLHDISEQNLRSSMMSVKSKAADLMKYKDDIHIQHLEFHLKSVYTLPSFQGSRAITVTCSGKKPKTNSFDKEISNLINVELLTESEKLANENKSLNIAVTKSNTILQTIAKQDRQRTVRTNTIKRHNTTISNLERSKEIWHKKYLHSQEVCRLLDEKAGLLKVSDQMRKKNLKLKKSKRKITTVLSKDHDLIQDLCEKENTLKQFKQEIRILESKVCELEEEIAEPNQGQIHTRTDGRGRHFHPKIREASYYAQNLGIAEDKASQFNKSIYETISGNDLIGDLPSRKSQSNFGREMKTLSQQQVRAALTDTINCTLKYDGTTKIGKHIIEVEVSTKDQTFLVGMREQSGGSAAEYVDIIKTCLSDITNKSIDSDEPHVSLNISNTMSDRVIKNYCVDRLLESDVLGNKVNSFRCAIYPLDTIGKEAEKCVLQTEKEMTPIPLKVMLFKRRDESDTQALIKNTGKLFYNDATGWCKDLTAYIKEKLVLPEVESKDINSKLFHRFVGNRFHIYFLDAGLVDYYSECLINFFEKIHVPTNGMQNSLYAILKSKCRSVTFRALGLVGKFVTGPWMRFMPTCEQILEVNLPLQKAVETLSNWSMDASPLMNGTADAVFSSVPHLKIVSTTIS